MAKSLPRVRPGVMARSSNLLAANILMFCVDESLKNNCEPIAIRELVDLTHEPFEKVIGTLEDMSNRGIIDRPDGLPWIEAGAFKLGRLSVGTILASVEDDEKADGKEEVNLFNVPPVPKNDRLRSGWDEVQVGTAEYRCEAREVHQSGDSDGLLYVRADLKRRDLADGGEWKSVWVDLECPTLAHAWEQFDELIADERKAHPLAVWAHDLPFSYSDENWVLLDEETHDALAKLFGVTADSDTRLDLGDDFAGPFYIGVHGAVPEPNRWPELGEYVAPAQAEEEEEAAAVADDTPPIFPIVLDDGTQVECYLGVQVAKGVVRVHFKGELTESGDYSTDVKEKELKPDLSVATKALAETQRARFLKSIGGGA